jgi:cytochrome c peroxidase
MTSDFAGGIACASCHPGGRQDGHTWHFTEGPRNTPLLAGRHLTMTAPYHWDGQLPDMPAFNTVIVNRMGGSGELGTGTTTPALADSDLNAIRAFLDGQSPPDNPYPGSLDPAQVQAGLTLFQDPTVGCFVCHAGPDFTDNGFHDVGSMQNVAGDGATNESAFFVNSMGQVVGPNTPSLHSIFASAPYLHDGSKADLLARVSDDAGGQHGHTSQLTAEQKADLVAFLETL